MKKKKHMNQYNDVDMLSRPVVHLITNHVLFSFF